MTQKSGRDDAMRTMSEGVVLAALVAASAAAGAELDPAPGEVVEHGVSMMEIYCSDGSVAWMMRQAYLVRNGSKANNAVRVLL